MGGGAWPFLVGGVICLVYSVNERDLNLLVSCMQLLLCGRLLRLGLCAYSTRKLEAITGL